MREGFVDRGAQCPPEQTLLDFCVTNKGLGSADRHQAQLIVNVPWHLAVPAQRSRIRPI